MRKTVSHIVILLFLVTFTPYAFSHCQIPCGIYGDEMRFDMIKEDITTIEKSIKEIEKLSKDADKNYNQIVRWVRNKERHADSIKHIVTEYFMTQRIKPVDKKDQKVYSEYVNKLNLLHEILVYAMKSKQSTDLSNVKKLKGLLESFRRAYFGPSSKEEKKDEKR